MNVPRPAPWVPDDQPTLGRWLVPVRAVAIVYWALGLGGLIAGRQTGIRFWEMVGLGIYIAIVPVAGVLATMIRQKQRELDRAWAARFHDMAMRDDLTGLYNRRCFHAELGRLAAECELTETPLSLAFVDLNDFKRINDTHGHEAGDAALQGVAACLLELVGERGLVARTGGDEFGVLLPGMTETDAHKLFGPPCRTMPVHVAGSTVGIDGTVGIASLDARTGVGQLLRLADDHLYERKRTRTPAPRAA